MFVFFFFNDTATTEIYTLSLHDALPIFVAEEIDPPSHVLIVRGENLQIVAADAEIPAREGLVVALVLEGDELADDLARSEEHTSELQSRQYLVCRLLLEKKKNQHITK